MSDKRITKKDIDNLIKFFKTIIVPAFIAIRKLYYDEELRKRIDTQYWELYYKLKYRKNRGFKYWIESHWRRLILWFKYHFNREES